VHSLVEFCLTSRTNSAETLIFLQSFRVQLCLYFEASGQLLTDGILHDRQLVEDGAVGLKLAHVVTQDSPGTENVPGDSQRSGAKHDWNNVPFPAEHADECDCANHNRKPVDVSARRKDDVNSKPDGEV